MAFAVVGGLAGVFGGSSEQGGGSAPMGVVVVAGPAGHGVDDYCCSPW